MTSSSVFLLLASLTTVIIPQAEEGKPEYTVFVPLTLLGIGYSILAASLWVCIPYACEPKLLGTAFGISSAIQNMGLTISPLIAAETLKTERE